MYIYVAQWSPTTMSTNDFPPPIYISKTKRPFSELYILLFPLFEHTPNILQRNSNTAKENSRRCEKTPTTQDWALIEERIQRCGRYFLQHN